jgi:hypothetical protein
MSFEPNVWKSAEVINVGGDWAFAVGVLENGTIRIAKGKLSAAKEGSGCPVSQVMKMNLKPKDANAWEQIKAEVDILMYATPSDEGQEE